MGIVESTKVSSRGQVIIPKNIREYTGTKEGTLFNVSALDEDTIVMKKFDDEQFLKDLRKFRATTDKLTAAEIKHEIKMARRDMDRDRHKRDNLSIKKK